MKTAGQIEIINSKVEAMLIIPLCLPKGNLTVNGGEVNATYWVMRNMDKRRYSDSRAAPK